MKTSFNAIFKEVCLLLGCVIGSGFVSGKELLLTFSSGDVFSVILFVVVLCAALYTISVFCSKNKLGNLEELNSLVFKKYNSALNAVLILCYFIVTATILAVANESLSEIFPLPTKVPLYSYTAAIFSFFVMRKGIDGIKKFSTVSIPLVLFYLLIVYIAYFDKVTFLTAPHNTFSALSYAFFGVVMSLGVISSTSNHMKKKPTLAVILIFGTVLALFSVLQLSLSNNPEFNTFAVPLFAIVKENSFLSAVGGTAVLFAILSSLLGNTLPIVEYADSFVKDFELSAALVFFLALLLSMSGLEFLAAYCFPAVSAVGLLVVAAIGFKARKHAKKNRF